MAWRRVRLHYCVVWVLMLVFAEARLGYPRAGLDEFVAVLMQVLSFPADFAIAIGIALLNPMLHGALSPRFFDTRWGIFVGWALFLGGGLVQWFVVAPWLAGKVRRRVS